jgi:small conductance mechanosensitive channel
MLLATASLNDLSRWARGNGLEIVLLVIGAVLLARLVSWVAATLETRSADRFAGSDAVVQSESLKHRRAVVQVIRWTTIVLVWFLTGILVLARFGVPLTSLVAPATVTGVAVGFGAQRVVQDILAGFFIVAEHQYGFGDVIRISSIGATTGVTGTVEDVTLRITRIRTVNGEVVIVPNGQITQVTNLSRDWARAVVDVPVPVTADVNRVNQILQQVGQEAYADDDLRPLMLDTPSVMGVESIEVDQFSIRVVARTLPGKQFDVSRQLRARIATALREEGIILPAEPDAGALAPGS